MPHSKSIDAIEVLPIFFGVLIGMAIVAIIVYYIIKNQDNSKALISKKVKVLEKPVQQGNVVWYVVECENGQRLKLRSFQGNKLFIAVGDIGIIEYRGQTIQTFKNLDG